MLTAPIPVDDAARLAALHSLHVLDTPREERFDRIVRLLTRLFHVPMAYVSLVDAERQWFKASIGIVDEQTPRSISFCGHAILSEQTFVVPDAFQDPRFCDSPLVTGEPYIRFYAGHPLVGPDGHRVGTLCIADRRPRRFSETDLQALRDLAAVVERELNLVEVVHVQEELIAAKEQAAEADRQKAEYLGRMVESQKQLVRELQQAADYVASLLPAPVSVPVRTRWRFVPSSQLGGDSFGYHWLDPDHFALYLLDVSGHGVGAALLSVSVMNTLRAHALADTDFRRPESVLGGLNDAYPMERHNGKYFTIWYGVYRPAERRLWYASAGHPPALLLSGAAPDRARPLELGMENYPIGMVPAATFSGAEMALEPFGKMYLFSDGVFEIEKPDGKMMERKELVGYLSAADADGDPDHVWQFVRSVNSAAALKDDFSLLEVLFT
jgi:sigma-B regulation protein RsbU (phosphoserine phosphatase)